MFSDESHFFVQVPRSHHVRRLKGESVTKDYVEKHIKYPKKRYLKVASHISVSVPFALLRYDAIIPIHRSFKEQIAPRDEKNFSDNSGVFQQDFAPCHKSKVVLNFFKKNKLAMLNWPGNFPDLNPIENLWSIIKTRLGETDCATKKKLIKAIIKIWYHDTKMSNNFRNLVDSMPQRVQEVLKNKGGHTIY